MNEPTIPPQAAFSYKHASAPPPVTVTAPSTTTGGSSSSQAPPSEKQQQPKPTTTSVPRASGPAIPVILNEAALDSPTFRSTAIHFGDQLDGIERWLDSYTRSTTKVVHDFLALEDTINVYLSKMTPPTMATGPDSPVLDADYTLPALRRAGDGAREWWGGILSAVRRLEPASVDPIRNFINNDMRVLREQRRNLEAAQKVFDTTLARYVGQSKTKEPSALREDAFAVFETRKGYLKASMDFCQMAPQVRAGLDKLLVRVCADLWREMRKGNNGSASALQAGWGEELERIRGWAREMEASEGVFKRELGMARRDVGESTLAMAKPSRELEDYSVSTVPYLGSKGPLSIQRKDQVAVVSEKQGWLFLRTLTGKPVRPNWIRRWYYCRDGIFGWLIQAPQGVLQGDEIGVLLCSARPAVQEERRFCFEIKTKTQTILLQAETQTQLVEWLEVFEVAKKKAIEASMGRDPNTLVGGIDPAFVITPPSIPEFSARAVENLDETDSSEKQRNLPVPGPDPNTAARSSFDVAIAPPRRSITTHLGREEGETGREHAARIMQKLDLHRKATFASSMDTMSASGTTGASLMTSTASTPQGGQTPTLRLPTLLLDHQPGSLAPATLAKPPISTSLSKSAILASANNAAIRPMSSGVLANYWGSSPYTAIYCPAVGAPPTPKPYANDPFVASMVPRTPTFEKPQPPPGGHRKTQSVGTTLTEPKVTEKARSDALPANYPPELRAQYAQFRLVFPTAPPEEKPVLVFNAAWSSSPVEGKEDQGLAGNGRIFVTSDRMYFYGHQLGLVVAYTISLDSITEVTSAPGRDCDFIFLHLNQDMQDTTYARIAIKVFLEDFLLLQSRLNLLIDDLQAAEPMDLSEIITTLLNMERNQDDNVRSPSVESWEEISSNTPVDDGTPFGRPVSRRVGDLSGRFIRYSRQGASKKQVQKFQLPAHAVMYEPEDMGAAVAERHFEMSAKACFHVLFGDKSFIFPKLYFERRAKEIAQGPWELSDHGGKMKRVFRFKVDYVDMLGRRKPGEVTDVQTIDIFNDHITYVVSHVRTPWHLPHSGAFRLVTKVVITHVAKSKCKLAVYTRTSWEKGQQAFARSMVERQALDDARRDGEELAEVATDQVRKLGIHSRTKRAIQVYGDVGRRGDVVVFSPDEDLKGDGVGVRPRTLGAMMWETGRSFMESAITSVMMWAFAAVKKVFGVLKANRVILVMLVVSLGYNLVSWGQGTSRWWTERRSERFMQRLGVGPNLVMGKAIYLADLEEASRGSAVGMELGRPVGSQCYDTFQAIVNSTNLDAPYQDAGAGFTSATTRAAARRLRRTRQRLAGYRHDLLVAMRVVNGIELEMVQSEWENWLEDENQRCERVAKLLTHNAPKQLSQEEKEEAQKVLGGGDARRKEALAKWHAEYCGSCEADHRALMASSQRASLVR
ncbi:SNF1-interacting protein [Podospora pseudocomata]|uniref:SNF1-interacting protein n=1 Tax=Podospora pseudocomata TaxID=2093779 RepID=A0ABR0G3Q0_9PEZI|nr:SNF1-interacting protein [Podospora pseudocomata]